jgi:hypothetical protein
MRRAVAAPMPEPAPVISATFPSSGRSGTERSFGGRRAAITLGQAGYLARYRFMSGLLKPVSPTRFTLKPL